MAEMLAATTRTGAPIDGASRPMTFEELLARGGEEHVEWVNGEVVVMSPASADHQRLRDFLLKLLSLFVEAHGLGEVLGSPFLMRLPTRPSGREPDLLFLAAEHADRLKTTYLDGAADLVVEITSPESDARDRGEKFVEYEAAGIPEYWLIDVARREVAFYRRGPDGLYRPGALDADGWYRPSVLPGFRLDVAWLWQRPLPRIADILPLAEAR